MSSKSFHSIAKHQIEYVFWYYNDSKQCNLWEKFYNINWNDTQLSDTRCSGSVTFYFKCQVNQQCSEIDAETFI